MRTTLREYLRLLTRYLARQWAQVLLLAGLLAGGIGLQLANPQVVRRFLDAVQAGEASAVLLRLALLFLGLALLQQAASVLATYVGEAVGWTATNALRADLAEHCLRLDLGFLNAHPPGEMIERVDDDVTTLANLFSQFVLQVLGNGLFLIGALLLLWREDWRVGLAVGTFAGGTLYALARLHRVGVPRFQGERQAGAEFYGFLEERLAGMEDIRANGAQASALHHFHRLLREQFRRSLQAAVVMGSLFSGAMFLFALSTAVAFAVGAYLYRRQAISIGTVYLIFQYTSMLQTPIDRLSQQLQDLQKAGAGVERIQELLTTQSLIQECAPAKAATLPAGPLAVASDDVSFGYDDVQPGQGTGDAVPQAVLHDVSFDLPPGTVLGLLGRTGSGKTTLSRLLFRFYDPTAGAIRLGSGEGLVDIRHVPLAKLRACIGMVTQNVQLFGATVRDNLTFFDATIPDASIRQAIADLGLGEWLASLSAGLDTVLQPGGGGLSAGQAQLLAFARVFLQDPGLVILDEASSRLDPASERLIERAIDRLLDGGRRTAIIIAHRPATLQRAGQILILEEGWVVERGPRVALAADPHSRFHRLLQSGLEEVLA